MQRKEMRAPVLITLVRNITIALLSFVSFPFAAQALGDSAMGIYSWANTFVYYFLIIARLGIPTIAIRECTKVKDNPELFNNKVQSFFILQLITTILSYLLMITIIFAGGKTIMDLTSKKLVFLLSINFLVGVFSFEWVYIALDRVFFMSLRSTIITVLTTLMIVIFIKNDHDLFFYALITISSTILTVVVNLSSLRKSGVKLSFKHKTNFKNLPKSLFFVFGITFIMTAYNQNDSLLLGYLDPSKSAVGSYAVGIRGIEIIITILTSLSAVFMVRTTGALKNNDLVGFHSVIDYSMNIIFFIAIPAVLFLIGLAPDIIGFIVENSPYWSPNAISNAILAVSILAGLMLTFSINDSIYQQVLVPLKKEKLYLIVMGIMLVFNTSSGLLLALFVFKSNPLFAVALSTLVSEIITLIIIVFTTKEYTFIHIFNLNNIKIIFGSSLALVGALLIRGLLPVMPIIMKIMILITVGGIIYLVSLFFMRENIIRSISPKEEKNGKSSI